MWICLAAMAVFVYVVIKRARIDLDPGDVLVFICAFVYVLGSVGYRYRALFMAVGFTAIYQLGKVLMAVLKTVPDTARDDSKSVRMAGTGILIAEAVIFVILILTSKEPRFGIGWRAGIPSLFVCATFFVYTLVNTYFVWKKCPGAFKYVLIAVFIAVTFLNVKFAAAEDNGIFLCLQVFVSGMIRGLYGKFISPRRWESSLWIN